MPWQTGRSRGARLHKCVAVVDRGPGKAWRPRRPRRPWEAGWALCTKSDAGVSWLPFLSFESIHPRTSRSPREADLSFVPRPSVRTRRSSEAGLPLGSFLGRGQHSAVGTEDHAGLTLLTLGSRGALLASEAHFSLRPSWSGEACVPRLALGSVGHGHRSVLLLRHVDHRPRESGGPGGPWLPHAVLAWVTFLSLGSFFSFWTLGSSHTLLAGEARKATGAIGTDFSLGPWWASYSRIPLGSRLAGRSLQPISTSG